LHAVAALDDAQFTNNNSLFNNIELLNYCDDKHGFLKITIERAVNGPELTGEYFSIAHESAQAPEVDAVFVERFKVQAKRL